MLKYLSAFLSLTVVLLFLNESLGQDKKKGTSVKQEKKTAKKVISRTVRASVETQSSVNVIGGQDSIRAKMAQSTFTIPKGYTAVDFQYNYYDPKKDVPLTTLGPRHIYSITEKRLISEAKGNKNLVLKPGKYRFSVGGLPGASGTLKFKLVPKEGGEEPTTAGTTPGPKSIPKTCTIRAVHWDPKNPSHNWTVIWHINDGKVTAKNGKAMYQGILRGNTMHGEWNEPNIRSKGAQTFHANGRLTWTGTTFFTGPDGSTTKYHVAPADAAAETAGTWKIISTDVR